MKIFKRIIITLISFILLFEVCCIKCYAAAKTSYKDVPAGAWYEDAVVFNKNKGFIKGYNNTLFGADDKITRGQLVTILWRMTGEPTSKKLNGLFRDVNESDYYGKAIMWASDYEIVKGYNEFYFGPNDPITRQDFTVIICRYARASNFKGNYTTKFLDENKAADYAKKSLKWANYNGVISGKDNKYIDPYANTTRAEAAAILMRFYSKFFINADNLNNLSLAQKNALSKARDMVYSMHFSEVDTKTMLVKDGFTEDEAKFAVRNLGVDWNEQAALTAEDYVRELSLSKQELINQLKYGEGFTDSQVNYAVKSVGY